MSAIPVVVQGTNGAALVRARSKFFFGMSIVLLLLVVSGFAPTLYLRAFFDVPPIPGYLYLHGGILTGWFVWLVVQTSLVQTARTATHRRLGVVGVVWAAAVVAGGLLATLNVVGHAVADGIDLNADISAIPEVGVSGVTVAVFLSNVVWPNIASVCAFAILVTSALLLRGRPQAHKRLMLIASISVIGPALARVSRWPPFGGEDSPFVLVVLLSLLAALVVHDLLTTKRVHPATLIGGALSILLGGVFSGVIASSPFGLAFTRSLQ
jgi:hypothetical protein